MPGATPVYGLPYQTTADPPNGPVLGQDLAEAVEAELQRIDATPQPVQVDDITTIAGISNTTPAAGTPVVGTAFVAPPSGKVYLTVTASCASSVEDNTANVGYELRSGSTVGTGTVLLAASFNRAVQTSEAVTSGGGAARITASNRFLFTGLTAGSSYNVRTMHWMNPAGSGSVFYRALLVEPVQ